MKARLPLVLAASTLASSLVILAGPALGQETGSTERAGEAGAVLIERADSWLGRFDVRELWGEGPLAAWMTWLVPALAILLGLALGRVSSWVLGALARRCEARGWSVQQQAFTGLVSPANVALFALGLAAAVANVEAFETSRLLLEPAECSVGVNGDARRRAAVGQLASRAGESMEQQ